MRLLTANRQHLTVRSPSNQTKDVPGPPPSPHSICPSGRLINIRSKRSPKSSQCTAHRPFLKSTISRHAEARLGEASRRHRTALCLGGQDSRRSGRNPRGDERPPREVSPTLFVYIPRASWLSLTFRDSKSSFEKKLRQWGLAKHNMGQHRWSAVGRILKRRKRAGKRSDVYVQGVMVSRDKVRREVSRHVALTLRSKFPVGPGMNLQIRWV